MKKKWQKKHNLRIVARNKFKIVSLLFGLLFIFAAIFFFYCQNLYLSAKTYAQTSNTKCQEATTYEQCTQLYKQGYYCYWNYDMQTGKLYCTGPGQQTAISPTIFYKPTIASNNNSTSGCVFANNQQTCEVTYKKQGLDCRWIPRLYLWGTCIANTGASTTNQIPSTTPTAGPTTNPNVYKLDCVQATDENMCLNTYRTQYNLSCQWRKYLPPASYIKSYGCFPLFSSSSTTDCTKASNYNQCLYINISTGKDLCTFSWIKNQCENTSANSSQTSTQTNSQPTTTQTYTKEDCYKIKDLKTCNSVLGKDSSGNYHYLCTFQEINGEERCLAIEDFDNSTISKYPSNNQPSSTSSCHKAKNEKQCNNITKEDCRYVNKKCLSLQEVINVLSTPQINNSSQSNHNPSPTTSTNWRVQCRNYDQDENTCSNNYSCYYVKCGSQNYCVSDSTPVSAVCPSYMHPTIASSASSSSTCRSAGGQLYRRSSYSTCEILTQKYYPNYNPSNPNAKYFQEVPASDTSFTYICCKLIDPLKK